ncbi:hypothetical protein K7432_013284 [Basidiobolus ranarum]|uniref:Uncharacterized protein n=1 Tax=Basidiobolus ranarum TaxID=34480 RepID=A0ABR2VR63_9FUNG
MSILKRNFSTARRGAISGRRKMKAVDDSVPYIEKLSKDEIFKTTDKCVLIDPGCGDLLYCMHETSTPQNKSVFRYTRKQRAIETKSRHFDKS